MLSITTVSSYRGHQLQDFIVTGASVSYSDLDVIAPFKQVWFEVMRSPISKSIVTVFRGQVKVQIMDAQLL
jgi:hypothetical protein